MPWRRKLPSLSCQPGRRVAVPPKFTLAASQQIYSKAEFFLFSIGKQRRLKQKIATESWYHDCFPTNICSSQPHLDVQSEAGEQSSDLGGVLPEFYIDRSQPIFISKAVNHSSVLSGMSWEFVKVVTILRCHGVIFSLRHFIYIAVFFYATKELWSHRTL